MFQYILTISLYTPQMKKLRHKVHLQEVFTRLSEAGVTLCGKLRSVELA